MQAQPDSRSVYRIDKFIVPPPARDEFMAKVLETHEWLWTMEGCLQNLVLEQVSGTGRYNVVTVVEWADAASLEKATAAMLHKRERDGFDPREMLARLGIVADLANYGTCAMTGHSPGP
ncbi:antibiotic biosynthesis monooxygenase [Pseudaminobacter sp. 19-2017]|uniref:Antibiotic biosynthesis monooxygenase n=2 Tax=Pseudaminobacter soli (ex Zhang et al. 2022) TaxID=2831468 RepID=A0A942EAZ7_9HYPH|nr:antibiotic biosynthesis monooxygenase [Pseudaminobacter soli]